MAFALTSPLGMLFGRLIEPLYNVARTPMSIAKTNSGTIRTTITKNNKESVKQVELEFSLSPQGESMLAVSVFQH